MRHLHGKIEMLTAVDRDSGAQKNESKNDCMPGRTGGIGRRPYCSEVNA
jgi:hypothetical protein